MKVDIISCTFFWAGSSAVEQEPFKLLVAGSNPARLTFQRTQVRILFSSHFGLVAQWQSVGVDESNGHNKRSDSSVTPNKQLFSTHGLGLTSYQQDKEPHR